jgi:putative glutamine amidotransferase
MHAIFESGKPILGICKGMQLLNIGHGGTLKQDIDENTYHFQPERGYEKVDTIEILWEDSWLAQIYPKRHLEVNSIHHQALDEVGT